MGSRSLTDELRDTYEVWNVDRAAVIVWLDEVTFHALPFPTRARLVARQVAIGRGAVPSVRGWSDLVAPARLRGQAGGHRFVWWPSLVAQAPREVLNRLASAEHLPSRHREVPVGTWRACAPVLPGARTLAGTFADGSGANCFGTVMAAAGVPGAAEEWMQVEPFETWLAASTRGGRDDAAPGTVLVWRDRNQQPVHAAVSLGAGWALEKSSQRWISPRSVHTVAQVLRAARTRGWRLQPRRLRGC